MFKTQMTYPASLKAAQLLDQEDPLSRLRQEFSFPHSETEALYFVGHSLGLMPRRARKYVEAELDHWERYGVEGHFRGEHPWVSYHENLTPLSARLVGAGENEVVVMNSLTVNLHLMMVSFYRPTADRPVILIENNSFPSDHYAVASQIRFHGFNPEDALVELVPTDPKTMVVSSADVIEQIKAQGNRLALVLLGQCNYLSGQAFNIPEIVEAAHRQGAMVGLNLAHGAGNLDLRLHDWNVDFAVWCSYKYLNAGPGSLAGTFIHQRHLDRQDTPRFEGWWGSKKETRFRMGPVFEPLPTAEAWQLSNPPILPMAAMRASLEIFDSVGMPALRARGDRLTGFLEHLLTERLGGRIAIMTPPWPARGSMLCVRLKKATDPRAVVARLTSKGVFFDFREPDILRLTPAPLYNSFTDVWRLVEVLDGEVGI